MPPLYWRPGCVHYLDRVRNTVTKQGLEWRPDPRVRLCECAAEDCDRPRYDCGNEVMARCAACERWFHLRCVAEAADGVEFHGLDVEWDGGGVTGPATRRSPNAAEPLFQAASRGLDVRMDPPVRSWERLAAGITEARYWADLQAEDGWVAFRDDWREAVRGNGEDGLVEISESEVDDALDEVEQGGGELAGTAWPLVCPFCDIPM